jgi:Flp pilus assembly protein CpaB
MQQRQNGRQLILFGIGTIVVVLLIGFMLTRGGGGSNQASAETATTPVVVAQQTVAAGTVFKTGQSFSDSFTIKQVPNSLVPFGAYHSLDQLAALTHPAGCGPVQSTGCDGEITTTQTLYQDTPVVQGMFTALGQYRQAVGPSFAIPYGYVGIAVAFDTANSVLGAVSPGDTIDLIASWKGGKIQGRKSSPAETQYALDNLKVISVNAPPAIGGSTSSSSSTSSAATTANVNTGSLVLLVRYQQALEIQHLKDFGWALSCVLRSAHATNIPHFRTLPVTDNWFFSKSPNPFSPNPGY